MSTDLAAENKTALILLLMFFIVTCGILQLGLSKVTELHALMVAGGAGAMLTAVLVLITNLVPTNIKHKLVFTRFVNELPACRVHRLIENDARTDTSLAMSLWPELFSEETTPNLRNSLWYRKIYQPVRNRPEVLQAHRRFLLYRDVCTGILMLILIAILWHFLGDKALTGPTEPLVFAVLVLGCLATLIAARNSGKRFVMNAVAVTLSP